MHWLSATRLPKIFFAVFLACWLMVVFIDMLNVGGLGEWVIDLAARDGSVFVMLFGEARPIEWMQWTCLGGAAMLAAQMSLLEGLNKSRELARFSLLIGLLFVVMLMEDAGDLRHNISNTIVATGIPQPFFPNFYRMLIYALYASIPIYAVLRYGSLVRKVDRMSAIFWSGFALYVMASVFSIFAPVGNFYEGFGEQLNQLFFGGRIAYTSLQFDPGYWIMDHLVEESLEVMGAILFLAFFAIQRETSIRRWSRPVDVGDEGQPVIAGK